jgi:hypothetical protein
MGTVPSERASNQCPCCCGCPSVAEHQNGDELIGTISSSCAELNGKQKRFVYSSGFWTAADDEPGDCMVLNNWATGSKITCVPKPDARSPWCCQYQLTFNAVQCCYGELYPSECACDPFRLKYTGIVCQGGPQGPHSGGGYTYLCECDCEWPVTLDIEFVWDE